MKIVVPLVAPFLALLPPSVAVRASASEAAGLPPSGPVLALDYTGRASNDLAIADFLYFVPLISPEPVTVSESPTNTLRVRVASVRQEAHQGRSSVRLAFRVSGQGFVHYAIDPSRIIRQHERRRAAGTPLKRQLQYIRYEGPGTGLLEVEDGGEGGGKGVTTVRLHFVDHGGGSPVTIGLTDLRVADGVPQYENQLVARVNRLDFTRDGAPPRMGVRVESVKSRDAGDSFLQNVKGRFTGLVATMVIGRIAIRTIGNEAMLDFGRAILEREPSFTFPAASGVKAL